MMEFPIIEPKDIIELYGEEYMRTVCDDECEVIDENERQVIHPNEDEEYDLNDVTKVWRENKNGDYILIWHKN